MGIEIQWPLVLFTLISGVGGGMLIPFGVAELAGKPNQKAQFITTIVSMVLLVIGGFCSMAHLASPQNVMAAVYNLTSFSGISIELILLGVTFVVALVLAILVKRAAGSVALKVFAALGIVAGVLLLFFCGHGYAMPSRPAWDTNLLPLAYLGTALAAGAFAYGLVLAACKPEDDQLKPFKVTALVCGILCAVACVAYGVAVLDVAPEATPVAFWGGMVVCGVVLAIILGVVSYLKAAPANLMGLAAAGFVVTVLAVLAVRVVMWDVSTGYLELFALAAVGAPVIP